MSSIPAPSRPADRPLSLDETLRLIAPAEGPHDPLPEHVDVLVVGGGPVGLTAANLLGSFGVGCLVVETKAVTSDMPKAIAIDDEYMRTLDGVGLTQALRPHLSRPFGVHFLSPFGFVLVKVPGFVTPNGFGNRNAVLQPVFEKVLLDGCRRFQSVRCHFGASLTQIKQDGERATATIETASGPCRLAARYVLACDGSRSFIRSALNIPFPGTRIDEPHLVVDLADFPDQVDHSRFFCNPRRPVNSVPAPYGGRRLEFMLFPDDDPARIVTDDGVRDLVDRHTPYRGVPLHIIRRAIYGFSERIADRLQDGRIFLLGDAAHVMPPFGGQGMNTGARDAANLCWKLAAVLRSQLCAIVLASYETERRDHIREIVDYSVRVGRLANIRSRPLAVMRDAAFALANIFPSVRRYFREMRHLPRPAFKQGLLVRDGEADDGLTGRILPRLLLVRSDGVSCSVDDFAGTGFALIGLGVGRDAFERTVRHPVWKRLDPRLITVNVDHAGKEDDFRPADDRGRALLARHQGRILVLRPDRYVAGSATPERFEALSDQLQDLLMPPVPGSARVSASPFLGAGEPLAHIGRP